MPSPLSIWMKKVSAHGGRKPVANSAGEEFAKRHPVWHFGKTIAISFAERNVVVATAEHWGLFRRLIDLQSIDIPDDHQDGISRSEFLAGRLDEYLHEFGGLRPRVVICTGGRNTASRRFFLPLVPRRQLKSALEFEAHKHLPYPLEDCYYDYEIVSRTNDKDHRRLRMTLHSATRQLVRDALAPIEKLGRSTAAVHLQNDALGTLLPLLPKFDSSRNYALVRLSRTDSEISFYQGCHLQLSHSISLGTTFELAQNRSAAMAYFSESLISEIQNSLEYYTGQFSTAYSNRIYVYGELSSDQALLANLTDRFGIEFCAFPFEALPVSQECDRTDNAISVHLATVASALCQSPIANLLPPALKGQARTRATHKIAAAGLLALSLGLLSQGTILHQHTERLKQQRTYLDNQISEFESSSLYATYQDVKERVNRQHEYLELIHQQPSYLHLNLKELSILAPQQIRLYTYDYQKRFGGQNLQVSGLVTSTDTPPEIILAEFVEALEQSPFYDSVAVQHHRKKHEKGRFELDFQLVMKGIS